MLDKEEQSIKLVTWDDIRDRVKIVNPDLYQSIESINPSSDFKLYKIKYAFGESIVKRGLFQYPSSDSFRIRPNELTYSPIPLGLVLQNSCEVFISNHDRIITMYYANAGNLIGIFELFDHLTDTEKNPFWDVTAGVRSLFMLPHVSDKQGLLRLTKYFHLNRETYPRTLSDQWHFFREIIEKDTEKKPWYCEMIFFTDKWFKFRADPAWALFNQHLLKYGWKRVQFAFDSIERTFIWQAIMEVVEKRNLKPRNYIANTIKHLFDIASSRFPGFIPIDQDPEAGPIERLQHIFEAIYGLKNYHPTFMGPRALNQMTGYPIYYSLNFPTLVEGIPPLTNKSNRLMIDLREIKLILDSFKDRSSLFFKSHPKLQYPKFEYFHTEKDILNEINLSNAIPKTDKRFIYLDKPFCQNSLFWTGSIKISDP